MDIFLLCPPSSVPSSPTLPSSPPIAVPSPSIGASPPAQHQREKSLLPQKQQQRDPQGLKTLILLSYSNRGSHLHQLLSDPTRHARNVPC